MLALCASLLSEMHFSTLALAAYSLYTPLVAGHGQVHKIITATNTYIAADAYAAADPTSPIRKLNTYGPAADMLGEDIVCGVSALLQRCLDLDGMLIFWMSNSPVETLLSPIRQS
ncbi:hypothetical protein FRB94_004664 [Tulasnella sp. JGI-2019a]|nr:hypothetical protein FRB93_013459 [Tulasnella sp. JGI-2019a]KAG9001573.1 hypothetical protein FRB94_004664 [Tulasnella sp. JGI-2019a]KAG9035049.1 hypothetical protein FRB95_012197 [Tulasnella sp. JGI-2019a]